MFAQKNSQMTYSMYRDVEKGQRVERDQIINDLIARYLQVGLTMPLLNLVSPISRFTNPSCDGVFTRIPNNQTRR